MTRGNGQLAAAYNRGLAWAAEAGAEWLMLADQDTRFPEVHPLSRLRQKMESDLLFKVRYGGRTRRRLGLRMIARGLKLLVPTRRCSVGWLICARGSKP